MTPIDDLGGDSRDLRTLGYPDPTEAQLPKDDRETRIRRFGRCAFCAGIATHAGALFASVSLAVATEGPTFHNPVAQMWGVLGLITVMLLGAVLIAVGANERIQRPNRAMVRQLARRTRDNRDRLDVLTGLVAAIPDRIAALERAMRDVPDYGRGVIDGVQMRADAMNTDADGHDPRHG